MTISAERVAHDELTLVGRKGAHVSTALPARVSSQFGAGLWRYSGAGELPVRVPRLAREERNEAVVISLHANLGDISGVDPYDPEAQTTSRILMRRAPPPGRWDLFGPGLNIVIGPPATGKTLFSRTIALGTALPIEADVHLFEAYDDAETGDLDHFARKLSHAVRAAPLVVVDSMQHFYLFGDAASTGGIYEDVLLPYGAINGICLAYGITLILMVNPAKLGPDVIERLASDHTAPTNCVVQLESFDPASMVFRARFNQRFGTRRWTTVNFHVGAMCASFGSYTQQLFNQEVYDLELYRSPYADDADEAKRIIVARNPQTTLFHRTA